MSPLLFNLYVNDLSVQLQKLPVGCCCGDMVVNHLMYADDIVLLAPSGKGMQTIIDTTYAYGNGYDIIYIIKERLETYRTMESYLPNSDRHAASWIFSDGPTKPTGFVKLRYNALKLFFYNVVI